MLRRSTLFLVSLFLFATCAPPEFANPLTSAVGAVIDKALVGKWTDASKDSSSMELEVTAKSGGVMRFVTGKPGREPMVFEGHISNVGKTKVMNLRGVEGDLKGDGYLFVRYELDAEGALQLFVMKDDAFHQAVKSGALKGHSGGGGLGTIVITDTSQKVLAFVKAQPVDELWEPLATFKRS